MELIMKNNTTRNDLRKELTMMVCSMLLQYPKRIVPLITDLQPEHVSKEYQYLFAILKETAESNPEIEYTDLFLKLTEKGESERAASLLNVSAVPGTIEAKDVPGRLIQLYQTDLAEKAIQDSLDMIRNDATGESIELIESNISDVLNSFTKEPPKPLNLMEVIEDVQGELDSPTAAGYHIRNFPTFEESTKGVKEGNYITITGGFKSAKTTFALNLMMDYAEQEISCAYISLEIGKQELSRKILSMLTNVPNWKYRTPRMENFTDEELKNISTASLKKLPVYLIDDCYTDEQLYSTVAKSSYTGIKIIFLDYLQLIDITGKNENRYEALGKVSRKLKALARRYNVVIYSLAQLNRTGATKADALQIADSIAPSRDSDFIFALQCGLNVCERVKINGEYQDIPAHTVTIDGKQYKNGSDIFLCKLSASRPTAGGDKFALQMYDCGMMREATPINSQNDFRRQSVPEYEQTGDPI
jgi:replicative DNA helicase